MLITILRKLEIIFILYTLKFITENFLQVCPKKSLCVGDFLNIPGDPLIRTSTKQKFETENVKSKIAYIIIDDKKLLIYIKIEKI